MADTCSNGLVVEAGATRESGDTMKAFHAKWTEALPCSCCTPMTCAYAISAVTQSEALGRLLMLHLDTQAEEWEMTEIPTDREVTIEVWPQPRKDFMNQTQFNIRLSPALFNASAELCQSRGITLSDLVRGLLAAECGNPALAKTASAGRPIKKRSSVKAAKTAAK
jgi:hypothetical protein